MRASNLASILQLCGKRCSFHESAAKMREGQSGTQPFPPFGARRVSLTTTMHFWVECRGFLPTFMPVLNDLHQSYRQVNAGNLRSHTCAVAISGAEIIKACVCMEVKGDATPDQIWPFQIVPMLELDNRLQNDVPFLGDRVLHDKSYRSMAFPGCGIWPYPSCFCLHFEKTPCCNW